MLPRSPPATEAAAKSKDAADADAAAEAMRRQAEAARRQLQVSWMRVLGDRVEGWIRLSDEITGSDYSIRFLG